MIRLACVTTVVLTCLITSGCGGPVEVGSANTPVFKPSRFLNKEHHSYQAGDSFSDLKPYRSSSWYFKTDASMGEIVAFYIRKMPDAEYEKTPMGEYESDLQEAREFEAEGDALDYEITLHHFHTTIGGKTSDDSLTVAIGDGYFSITETIAK